ncbi:protein SIEL-like [Trifolium pratense]|uniref:protein SIEL-like n=1 Tax=Trifolium pratense TaxID=57577 RepID=UPI001E694967|nr:protein SIEL-like [Trifolium pratense]
MDDTPQLQSNSEQPLTLHTLSSIRSLLINPSTPKPTLSSILQTLTRSSQLTHHTLNLLTDLAIHHPSFSQLALDSLLTATESPTRLAVDSLASISELSFPDSFELDDGRFVSLCFGPSIPGRIWMLKNAGYLFKVRPALLFTVLLGFTKDPYPYVRAASLEGLVGLSERGDFNDVSMVKGCYQRALQLLTDMEDCVRISAVRVVASWGLMLSASNADMKAYWCNEVFAKLCSMVRDMSMKVRVEAFNGLAKMEIVSKDFLLQSLSKRVLRNEKQMEAMDQSTSEQFVTLATSVAGALVHGLEEEFFEVRKSACQSLHTLTVLSVEFAREALDLLMDMLNDDSVVVRLQALETMHHMAINGCLKLQEKHLHMFLGALVDNCREVRCAERKILKIVKLNDLAMFKSSIDRLMENLDSYLQDEADVFSAFSHLGRNHKKFVGYIVKETFEEVEAAFEGNDEFKSARIAALLIISISAPLFNEYLGVIPPVLFSYAVTLLDRIYYAFSDIMDKDALLAYLCEKSRPPSYSAPNISHGEGEQQLPLIEGDTPNCASNGIIDSEVGSQIMKEQKELPSYQVEQHQSEYSEVTKFVNFILAKCPDMWQTIETGLTNEVLRSLRCLKEELSTMKFDSLGSHDALAFALLYIRIIILLVEVWEHLLPAKGSRSHGMGELEFKLGKLDRRIKELMSTFVGFSAEEELNMLELILVTYALRLCKLETICVNLTFKRLTSIYSCVESILKERSVLPSNFVVELGKLLHECSLQFDRCLKLFSLKKFVFHGTVKHLKAELSISNNDSLHPFPFVSGLPVSIPCKIKLHNIISNCKLWLRMSLDDGLVQYVFLDLDNFIGTGDVKNFDFVAPFYRTPKSNSFTLKVCISLECLFENVSPIQRYGGPKYELVPLCKEKQVYYFNVNKD